MRTSARLSMLLPPVDSRLKKKKKSFSFGNNGCVFLAVVSVQRGAGFDSASTSHCYYYYVQCQVQIYQLTESLVYLHSELRRGSVCDGGSGLDTERSLELHAYRHCNRGHQRHPFEQRYDNRRRGGDTID